jgi:hypothetical protein
MFLRGNKLPTVDTRRPIADIPTRTVTPPERLKNNQKSKTAPKQKMKTNLLRSTANMILTISALALALTLAGCATHPAETAPATAATAAAGDAYPIKTCVVSGDPLGKEPYVFTHNGQTIKLCCKDCLAKFNAEPAKYLAKITAPK